MSRRKPFIQPPVSVLAEPYWICAKENLSEGKPYPVGLEDTVIEYWKSYFIQRAREDRVEIKIRIYPNTDPAYKGWCSVIEIAPPNASTP